MCRPGPWPPGGRRSASAETGSGPRLRAELAGHHVRQVILRVVLHELVIAEIIVRVTPDGMDVVGLAGNAAANLGVLELDQKAGSLHAVVVRLAALTMPGPGERELLEAAALQPAQVQLGGFFGQALDIAGDHVAEER